MTAQIADLTGSEKAIWFGPQQRGLFGWLGVPDGRAARGGVLLCPPIGADSRATHRAYRHLAAELLAAGFLTLRFDYDGTGDSAGEWADPHRVKAWTASVLAAAELARNCGVEYLAAVGMRLGATVLAHATSAESLHLDATVWWDPVVRGRTFLREQQMLLATFEQAPSARQDGAVETSGYLFGSDLVGELRELSIDKTATMPARYGERMLVLTRPDRPAPDALTAHLAKHPDVTWGSADGQEQLLDVWPDLARVPDLAIETVTKWIDGAAPTQPRAVRSAGRSDAIVAGGDSDHVIRESSARIGPIGLFSIVTEPISDEAAASEQAPLMIFLNCSTETRIGPARQWVELSRQWARAGVRSARVDFSGLGDSPVHPGQNEHTVYAPQCLDDLQDMAKSLSPADPRRVVFIGLCSGAYSALEAALAFRPLGICVINPILHHDTAYRPGIVDARRRAFRPMWRWLYRFAVKHRRVAQAIWRTYCQFAVRQAPAHVFAQAIQGGTRVLAIFSDSDLRPFRETLYWRRFGEPRLAATGRFQLDVLSGIDHQLYLQYGRQLVADRLTDHVLENYATR